MKPCGSLKTHLVSALLCLRLGKTLAPHMQTDDLNSIVWCEPFIMCNFYDLNPLASAKMLTLFVRFLVSCELSAIFCCYKL